MKVVKILAILIFSCFIFWYCSKNPFAHVEMHGRIINSVTNAPVPSVIELWGNDQKGTKEGTYLGQIGTSDGTFDLKTQAASSGKYYLYIEPKNNGRLDTMFMPSLNNGHNVDLGNILLH